MEIDVPNLEALPQAARTILDHLPSGGICTLQGDLGAGKTTLVKAICQVLGVREVVNSPTYALVHEYSYSDEQGQTLPVYHLDLYRIQTLEEALDIGIEEYLSSPGYCFIEWPDLITPLLPDKCLHLHLSVSKNSGRKIVFLEEL